MLDARQTAEREGPDGEVEGRRRGPDAVEGEQQSRTTGKLGRAFGRVFPPSLRASLVLVVLVPTAAAVGLASRTAIGALSNHSQAVVVQNATLALDSLVRARTAVQDEYVPSAALVYAASLHISPAVLDGLLGVDFVGDLASARNAVDHQPVLRTTPSLDYYYGQLAALRVGETEGRVSYADVSAYFQQFGAAIDAEWLTSFDSLSRQAASAAAPAIGTSLTAMATAFATFKWFAQESTLASDVLTAPSTPLDVEDLIEAFEEFQTSTASFPGQLGPRAAAAWRSYLDSPLVRTFDKAVTTAINVGLAHGTPPYAADIEGHAAFFTADVQIDTALTTLVLAASADLRAVTANQESSSSRVLLIDSILMALGLVVALGGPLMLSRSVGRPLARIVSAADAVRVGDFDLPTLDESGPKELALAAGAFNEMSSTLRAVEAHAVALAGSNLDDPLLSKRLPGRTGLAFQTTLDLLQSSIRTNEGHRRLLHDRATHDSLTGLLNRAAATEAIDRDLARARRSGESVALLFVDLDGLKATNDTFGHEGGDAAIRVVAEALRTSVRQGDIVARFGGDEFVVSCIGGSDRAGPSKLAERIRQRVTATALEMGGRRVSVDCSIGMALSEPADGVQDLIGRADQALYIAKADGRGRVRWSETATSSGGYR
jgi:diguanylate cyclase (GGDEF)-like protein